MTRLALALLALVVPCALGAQDSISTYADAFESRLHASQPQLAYTVRADPADLSAWRMELAVRNAPDTLRLTIPVWAPGAYRLVDFWRQVRDLQVTSGGRVVPVVKEDSATWRAVVRGGEAVVRWSVGWPTPAGGSAPSNRSFLVGTGGLLDGPASWVHLAGRTNLPAHVTVDAPAEWRIATGLVPTADPRVFFAPSVDVLIDSPVLMGALRVWQFAVRGIPHRVAYWPRPGAAPFDTARFVDVVRRVVETAAGVAGTLPYREYTFLYVDGSGGGLEHLNSTTIGAPSATLAGDPADHASVTAHEYFHLWNVKRLRPAVLGPFDYARAVRTTSLWWSEGVTDYFAEEILRRAGLEDAAAAERALESNLTAYFGNPGHARVSPERSSWTAWDPSSVNGGYSLSYYLSGALTGELLEIELRDRTDGRRGMDDVLRLLLARHAGARGFGSEDVVRAVNDACGCDLQGFFARHIQGTEPLPAARVLALAGWRLVVDTAAARVPAARTEQGSPAPDLRLAVQGFAGMGSAGGPAGGRPRLAVGNAESVWGRAGLVTGDELVSVDGRPIADGAALRAALAGKRIGDRVRVDVVRAGTPRSFTVTVAGYRTVAARLEDLPTVTPKQRLVRQAWLMGGTRDAGRGTR
jgi:predicted metalloprotease with PDZ domain